MLQVPYKLVFIGALHVSVGGQNEPGVNPFENPPLLKRHAPDWQESINPVVVNAVRPTPEQAVPSVAVGRLIGRPADVPSVVESPACTVAMPAISEMTPALSKLSNFM